MFKPSGCKAIGIRKCEFVAKTQIVNCFIRQHYKNRLIE